MARGVRQGGPGERDAADAGGARGVEEGAPRGASGRAGLEKLDLAVGLAEQLERHPAQQLFNHNGTTVRLLDDGRVSEDNPFVGHGNARPEIWTYGHRNAQGLAVHPDTGEVWLNEHGPQGGDEVNLLRPGANAGVGTAPCVAWA